MQRLSVLAVSDGGARVQGERGPVNLSSSEWAVLRTLLDAGAAVVPREAFPVDGRAVDFAVRRIREKIEQDPSAPRHLVTEHGLGYRLGAYTKPSEVARALVVLRDRSVDVHLGLVLHLGAELPLTTQQRTLLRALVEADAAGLPRTVLARVVGARPARVSQLVRELRLLLEACPDEPRHLLTCVGGYRFVTEVARTNLPPPPAGVGRSAELERCLLVARPGTHTRVFGPPGVGTSFVGVALCHQLAGALPGGAWWVDATGPAEALLAAVAHRLRLPLELRHWETALRRRAPMALVLDGLEPDVRLAPVLDALRACTLVSTGRARVEGAAEVELFGLPTDDGIALYHLTAPPGSAPSPDTVRRTVAALGGHPLGIKVAARTAAVLGSVEDDALRELVVDRAIDASFRRAWAALPRHGRQVLANATVFRAPFDLDAARQVTGVARAELQALVDASLVERAGAGLWALPRTFRAWLVEQEGPASAPVAGVYTQWFVDWGRSLARGVRRAGRSEAERAWPDLLAAAEAVAPVDPAAVVDLAILLTRCYRIPPSALAGLRASLSEASSFEGQERWLRREASLVYRTHPQRAESVLARAVASGLSAASWSHRSLAANLRSDQRQTASADPGSEAPADPFERHDWAVQRGLSRVRAATSEGAAALAEGIRLLAEGVALAEQSGDPAGAWDGRGHLVDARRMQGVSHHRCAGEVVSVVAALDALGERYHAAIHAGRGALHEAIRGRRAAAEALLDRFDTEVAWWPPLARRWTLVRLVSRLPEPDRDLRDAALVLVADAEAADDGYCADFARLVLATSWIERSPADSLEAAQRIGYKDVLPAARDALVAWLDPAQPPPARLAVQHWVNDLVDLHATRSEGGALTLRGEETTRNVFVDAWTAVTASRPRPEASRRSMPPPR